MTDLLEGSRILGAISRISHRAGAAARRSLIWGKKPAEWRAPAAVTGKRHPVEALVRSFGASRIAETLYHYGANAAAAPVGKTGILFFFFFCLAALKFCVGGAYLKGGIAAVCAAVALLFFFTLRGAWADWIGGAPLLSKLPPLPRGSCSPRMTVWWALCGLIGGLIGWKFSLALGGAAALGLAVAPVFFGISPYFVLLLLGFALPLAGTTVCWALSAAIPVLYLFRRAFGGVRGVAVDREDLLLAVFPVFCVFSTLFSFHRADSAKVSLMWLGLFVCVFFIKRIIRRRRQLIALLVSFTAGAAVSGLFGLWQALSGSVDTRWTDTSMFDDVEFRVYSTFANPNVFGEYLLLMIPLIAALAFYVKKPWQRWALIAADALLTVNLAFTYSRGCYVGLGLTALVFLLSYSKKWTFVLAALGIPLALLLLPASMMNRMASIGNMGDGSTTYRMMIYVGVTYMLGEYWLGGVGLGDKAFNRIYPYFQLDSVTAQHSHSLFFQSWLNFGLVGLGYVIGTVGYYQRQVVRARNALPRRDRLLMLGFGSLVWGFAVQSFFDYSWYNYRVFQFFWIVLALGLCAPRALSVPETKGGVDQ